MAICEASLPHRDRGEVYVLNWCRPNMVFAFADPSHVALGGDPSRPQLQSYSSAFPMNVLAVLLSKTSNATSLFPFQSFGDFRSCRAPFRVI